MGVYCDGSYGIQPGLIYSFPVTCEKGEWNIVQGRYIPHWILCLNSSFSFSSSSKWLVICLKNV
jgi:malate/lactate dehydrogenase